jgi:hypothetical protein
MQDYKYHRIKKIEKYKFFKETIIENKNNFFKIFSKMVNLYFYAELKFLFSFFFINKIKI